MSFKEEALDIVRALKLTDIAGCITGSLMGEITTFDQWDVAPDIDLFCYSKESQVHACAFLKYSLGLMPGCENPEFDPGEESKLSSLLSGEFNRTKLVTIKMKKPDSDVVVNVSMKNFNGSMCNSAGSVIHSFDMNIIMNAYDIQSHNTLDMREQYVRPEIAEIIGVDHGDKFTAIPNQWRHYNYATWDTARYVRQWDRVLKYASRGYDMLPLAKFYRYMIERTLANGKMFKTDSYGCAFEEFEKQYKPLMEIIDKWIKEHE